MSQPTYKGKFIYKGASLRRVRSVRLTDETWQALHELAKGYDSLADFLEDSLRPIQFKSEIELILNESLKLPANCGGAIKKKIRQVLALF